VLEAIDPRNRYTETDWLLLGILNSHLKKPFDPFIKPQRSARALTQDELKGILSKPRREI